MLVDAHPIKEWYETITVSRLVSRRERMLRRRRLSSSPIASCARFLPGRRDVVLLSLLLITSLRVGVFMPRLLLVLDKVEGVMELFWKDLNLFSTRR